MDLNVEEVEISPMNCAGAKGVHYQSTTLPDNSKSFITEWDPDNGGYGAVITLLPSLTDPPFRSINSCSINPRDLILYCSMEINGKGSFLVRIQDGKVGFVDKLLGWRFSAAFDEEDNYYVYGEHSVHPPVGKMSVITGVSQMKAFSSWAGVDAQAETKNAEPGVKIKVDGHMQENYRLGADLALLKLDLARTGEDQTYFAGLVGSEMKLLRVSPEPYELFTLGSQGTLPTYPAPNGKPRVWGTAWAFNSSKKLYFSADDGVGLYGTKPSNIDVEGKKVFLNEVGPAKQTDWNDGISCGIDDIDPDPTECTHYMYRSTTEKRKTPDAKSSIQVLDWKTGTPKKSWEVKAEGLEGINACAIGKDSYIYCMMQFSDGGYLARLDEDDTHGFLLKAKEWAYAGTFDPAGNYWFFQYGSGLNKITGLPAYSASKTRNKFQQEQDFTFSGSSSFKNKIGADLAILSLGAKTYLVSILETCNNMFNSNLNETFHNRVTLVDITDGNAKEAIELTDTGSLPTPPEITPPGQTPGCQTWGSSWNLKVETLEYILFAPDSGQGIYQLMPGSVDLEQKTVSFKYYGEAAPIEWNNGFSCMKEDPKEVVHEE